MIEIGDLVSVKHKEGKHAWVYYPGQYNIVKFVGNDAEFQDAYPDTEFSRNPVPGDIFLWYVVVEFLDVVNTLTKNTDDTFGRGVISNFDQELGLYEVTFPEASFPTKLMLVDGSALHTSSEYPETPNTRKVYFPTLQLNVYGKD